MSLYIRKHHCTPCLHHKAGGVHFCVVYMGKSYRRGVYRYVTVYGSNNNGGIKYVFVYMDRYHARHNVGGNGFVSVYETNNDRGVYRYVYR